MIEAILFGGAALIATHKIHCKGFNTKAMQLFRVKNLLPNNWYDETDKAIETCTTVQELETLKQALKEQSQAFWITERERYATLYLLAKAGLRARFVKSGKPRISIKSFNQ